MPLARMTGRGEFQFLAAGSMPTMGDIDYEALTTGQPVAALLIILDVPKRKLRYPLKWVFVSLVVASLAGTAATRLLSYSGVLVR